MTKLPKHLRPRWRYLAVALETWPDAEINRRDFQRELWFAARSLLGDAATAAIDATVVWFEHGDGHGTVIVRARRGETERARAAIACIDAIDGHRIGLRVRGISGTVRACEEKYIRGPREPIDQRNVVFGDTERCAVVRADRVDVRIDDEFAGATKLDLE